MEAVAQTADIRDDVEVPAKATRRRFPAEYKRRILKEADACTRPGEIGALLRREGLYSSQLADWRHARERGELDALSPRKRGRKPKGVDPRDKKIEEQAREIRRWQARAERAEALVELQKKVAALLGRPFPSEEP
jgi:transposase-like protein